MGVSVLKDIPGYPFYKVSANGNVWSNKTNKFLAPNKSKNGYTSVELFNNGKSKRVLIHRLVALAFIPNPDDLPCVNHKNEIRDDNRSSNLEWCTHKYNSNYGNCKAKIKANRTITPEQLRKFQIAGVYANVRRVRNSSTNEEFDAISIASKKYNVNASHITEVCKGTRKTAGGYKWEYIEG